MDIARSGILGRLAAAGSQSEASRLLKDRLAARRAGKGVVTGLRPSLPSSTFATCRVCGIAGENEVDVCPGFGAGMPVQ